MSREDIVVANQPEIQVYIGETGYIAIKQVNWPDDDVVIILDPIHADSVAKAIIGCAAGAKEARKEWVEDENGNS